jgi:hypothetical protein
MKAQIKRELKEEKKTPVPQKEESQKKREGNSHYLSFLHSIMF